MSKRAAKRGKSNLEARRRVYEAGEKQGRHRPGSQNPHKSFSKEARKAK